MALGEEPQKIITGYLALSLVLVLPEVHREISGERVGMPGKCFKPPYLSLPCQALKKLTFISPSDYSLLSQLSV